MRLRVMGLVAVVVLSSACGAVEKVVERSGLRDDASFYDLPEPIPAVAPGSVIRSEEVDPPPGPSSRAWRLLYRSTSVAGAAIVVSGVIVVPDRVDPERRVVSVAHQIRGIADRCAPSREPDFVDQFTPGVAAFLDEGYIVVASDFEGLGVVGDHTMLVGTSEAQVILDAALAAQQFPPARGSRTTIIVGDGQGGLGSLIAAEIAPRYAPDVDLVGVVASSPVTNPRRLFEIVSGVEGFTGFAVQGLLGYAAAYPDYDLATTLTPKAFQRAQRLKDDVCWRDFQVRFPDPPAEVFRTSIADDPVLVAALAENAAGISAPTVPILIPEPQSARSEPPNVVEEYVANVCALGATIDYVPIDVTETPDVFPAIEAVSVPWVVDRFAGEPAPSSCP